MSQPADLDRCAQIIMETVPRVMHTIRSQMRSHGSHALSVPQFRTLAYLHRHAGASLSDVALHLGITAASASNMVDRLVQHGFVDRAADPGERRRAVLSLTADGVRLLDSARAATRARIAEALSGLAGSQVDDVIQAMSLLQHLFREVSQHEHDGP